MRKNRAYKKEKQESFFQKFTNFVLTIVIAILISSQVCTAANNNLRFAQVSDVHFSSFEENTSYKFLKKSPELLDDAIFQLNTSKPYEFVIFTGDLINVPKTSELDKFLKHVEKLETNWYAINGNHDIAFEGTLTKSVFREKLHSANHRIPNDKSFYAFTPKRGFRVICLDSIINYKLTSNGEIGTEQFEWLKNEIKNHPKDIIIICTHVPIYEPFSSPNHKMNNEYDLQRMLKGFNNVIVVLQGHYHCTKAIQKENVVYISSPSLVTFPNAFRVININSNKNRVVIDVFLKETNLKEVQTRSRMRVLSSNLLYGDEKDRNTSFEIKKNKE
ncbi:MAG: metallophosphoesterase [bacterium]|nr:metallophosphoesterase [bacterium]